MIKNSLPVLPIKMIKIIFSRILFFIALAVAAANTLDLTYCKRVMTYPFISPVSNVDWYTPREEVWGAVNSPLFESVFADQDLSNAQVTDGRLVRAAAKSREYAQKTKTQALIVLKSGKAVMEWYAPGFSQVSQTNSMSMAKTVLAMLIGIAISEKKIPSENSAISQWIPEWAGDARGKITIRDLLEMRDLFEINSSAINPFSDLAKLHMSNDVVGVVLSSKLKPIAENKFEYNNLSAQFLGLVLDRAVKMHFSDYLSHES